MKAEEECDIDVAKCCHLVCLLYQCLFPSAQPLTSLLEFVHRRFETVETHRVIFYGILPFICIPSL